MRCRPRPGSRFYSLARLLCRRECWEPLYDLITPPLRRGINACRRSGIRHFLAPPPGPLADFCPFQGWDLPFPHLAVHHWDASAFTFLTSPFSGLSHLRETTAPFSRFSPDNKMSSPGQPTRSPWRCLRLQRAFTPITRSNRKAEPAIVTWLPPPAE